MNSLYKDLEAVEGAGFRDLHLLAESLHLLDNTETQTQNICTFYIKASSSSITRSKCCKMWDLFTSIQATEHQFQLSDTPLALLTRFSLTIPSLAAKKARTWEMKCFSSGFKRSQCAKSLDRSTWKTQYQQYTCLFGFILWWQSVLDDSVSFCCLCENQKHAICFFCFLSSIQLSLSRLTL